MPDRSAPAGNRRTLGRALITTLAAELNPGSSVRIVQRCAVCGGPHGRPLVTGAALIASVAYADPWVVVAVTPETLHAAIGIDAERDGAVPDLTALFGPADPPDLQGWTAIEAVLKADGRGILAPPQNVEVDSSRGRLRDGPWFTLHPVHDLPGMIVTLAVSVRA